MRRYPNTQYHTKTHFLEHAPIAEKVFLKTFENCRCAYIQTQVHIQHIFISRCAKKVEEALFIVYCIHFLPNILLQK